MVAKKNYRRLKIEARVIAILSDFDPKGEARREWVGVFFLSSGLIRLHIAFDTDKG